MLVRECYTEIRRDENGKPYTFSGERMVEMPGVLAEADALAAFTVAKQAEATATGNDLTLRQQAEAALVDLRIYRDRATTTTAQDKAAIKLLVRVAIGLIRLVLKRLDGAS